VDSRFLPSNLERQGRKGLKVELTEELIEHHARCKREGVPIAQACAMAGHGVSVYYRWVREAEEWRLIKEMGALGLFDFDAREQAEYDAWVAEREAAA
jgi:hypothetical protein